MIVLGSRQPGAHREKGIFGVLLVVYWVLAAIVPLTEDELYYWAWSRSLELSYFDHPPLIALLIRVSTAILGDSSFGIRFPGTLLGLGTLAAIRRLTDNRALFFFLLATPVCLLGPVLMTPDTPMLFFWALYLLWWQRIDAQLIHWKSDPIQRVYNRTATPPIWWCLGGALLGMGLLSKYTIALLVPSAFLYCLAIYPLRAWIAGFALHGLVALVCFLPVLIFNFQNDFVSFRFQWWHAIQSSGLTWEWAWRFLSSQWALVGFLPFIGVFWIALRQRDLERYRLFLALYALPMGFFLIKSFHTYLEANWALGAYLAFWPIAGHLVQHSSFRSVALRLTTVSFVLPWVTTAAVLLSAVAPSLGLFSPMKDRFGRWRSYRAVAMDVARVVADRRTPVFASTYQWVATLRYAGVHAEQFPGMARNSEFTRHPTDPCQFERLILIQTPQDTVPDAMRHCLPNAAQIAELPIVLRQTEIGKLEVRELSK